MLCRAPAVLSKEEIDAQKAQLRAIDLRPIKKVAEAKARKKKRLAVRPPPRVAPWRPTGHPLLLLDAHLYRRSMSLQYLFQSANHSLRLRGACHVCLHCNGLSGVRLRFRVTALPGEPGEGAHQERGDRWAGGRADAVQAQGGGEDLRPRTRRCGPGRQGEAV